MESAKVYWIYRGLTRNVEIVSIRREAMKITNEQLDCAIIMLSDVKRGYNFTVISDYILGIIVPALRELKERRKLIYG